MLASASRHQAGLARYDSVSISLPTVEERPPGAIKLFVECRAFPLHDGKFMHALALATEQSHIGFEDFRSSDNAGIRCVVGVKRSR